MRTSCFVYVLFAVLTLSPIAVAQSSAHIAPIENTMARADYQKVISQGPQKMIASIQVAPHSIKGRFVGFKLVQVLAHSPLATSQTIVVGDVILSVNGHSLERPDQFMRAWEDLSKAKGLEVHLLRGDKRVHYRWSFLP